ncbi:MAG: hypothetical protein ACYCUW_08240 [bacterium]
MSEITRVCRIKDCGRCQSQEIPNKETMKAIREAERGEVTYSNSVEDLMRELRS